jgi:molybdopterin converting factor subunit 1
MQVRVLYFGVLRERFGVADEPVELLDGSTVGALLDQLRPRSSEVGQLWRSLAVAVNREYSSPEATLFDGDEIALLPPVSGGCGAHVDGLGLLANEGLRTSYQSERYVD